MRGAHEDFERGPAIHRSSNRTFGLVLASFFALIVLLPVLRGHSPRLWPLPISAALLILALLAPAMLGPLNRAWTALAIVLQKITNPVVLGLCFYLIFTPFGWLLRRMGKDFLRLKFDPAAESYWLIRQPPGPPPESMSNQF